MKNEQMVKIPPHSGEAEHSILGNLIKFPYLLDEAIGQMDESDFYYWESRSIFKCLKSMQDKGIRQYDILLIAEYLAREEKISADESFRMVADYANTPYSEACLQSHISLVVEKSKARKALAIMQEASSRLFQQQEGAIDYLKESLTNMDRGEFNNILGYSAILNKTLEQIDLESNKDGRLIGISSGLQSLDFYTNGFQPGQLIVVGARPSVGKSLFMLNMAEYIGINLLKPAVIFSLEMNSNELAKRTLSRFARVKGIFKGKVTNEDWDKIQESLTMLTPAKLFINDKSGLNVSQIRAYANQIKSQQGALGAIFIDYLGLMNGEGENETLRLGAITRELKILAKDIAAPIILLSQLNRDSAKRETEPRLFDLRQSGCIEQDADIVLLIDRKLEETKTTIYVAKNRNGMCGKLDLIFNPDYFEFKEPVT